MPGEIHRNPTKKKANIEVRTICEIDGSSCSADSEGFGSCGDTVDGCIWHDKEPKP